MVAGVDGCRGGWVVVTVLAEPDRPSPVVAVEVADRIAPVVERLRAGELAAVAIDMPMGLPPSGPRTCDVELRRRLGPRRSSVFPTPPRGLLGSATYDEAQRRSRAIDGKGLSKQAFNLLRRIAELDDAIEPSLADRLVEAHPESAFAELAGAPLADTKRTPAGRRVRLDLLGPRFPGSDEALSRRYPGAAPDDVLDAAAIAWTAQRWVTGGALVFGDGSVDERGLPMRVAL